MKKKMKMFISYSSSDNDFVKRIEQLLETEFKNKIETVISVQRKEIGGDIPRKIIGNIEECDWFLVLLTGSSILNSTVMQELGYAFALHKPGIITQIIPIIEGRPAESGRYTPIELGDFFDRNLESSKYFPDEARWDECISDLSEYLSDIYEKEIKSEPDVLEYRSEESMKFGNYWEAAEKNRFAAKKLIETGDIQRALDNYRKAIERYLMAEQNWEAATQYNTIAKILKNSGKPGEAAKEYRNRGDLLYEMEDYSWEAAKALERAGSLFAKEKDIKNARQCYKKAILIYEEDGNDPEADNVRKRLKQLS